jgi:NifU-like protein
VTDACKAGGGCGQCIPEIEEIITRVINEEEEKNKKPAMTQLQKIRLIEETIDREIRPILRRDGGDLELHDVDGNRVFVKFMGACVSCPVSSVTLKDVVETQLREAVSDDLIVEAV